MKLKYQQGGALSLPFAVFQPFVLPGQSQQPTTDKSAKKEKGVDMKDIYSMFKEIPALPGDRQAVLGTLSSLLSNIEYKLNNPEMFGNSGSIANEYLQALNYVGNLRFQHDSFIKARDTAVSKGSLHEVAINAMGQIMVEDMENREDYHWLTPEEYVKNQDTYRPITNSELLMLRAYGKGNLVFDQASIETIANGVGIKEVTELLQSTISNLGTSTSSNNAYVTTRTNKILKGITDYQEALKKSGTYNASVQDLYKAKLLTESQASQVNAAMLYLYQTLPESYRALLKMKSDGTKKGAQTLIGTLITANLDEKVEFDATLKNASDPELASSSEGGDKSRQSNPYEQIINGTGGTDKTIYIVPGGTAGQKVDGKFYGQFPKVTSEMSIDAFLSTGAQGLNINSNKEGITFGDQKIDPSQLKDIMYDNSGVSVAILPIKKDMLGNISVNMDYVNILQEIDDKIKKNYPNATKEEKEKLRGKAMKEKELDQLVDENGMPRYDKFAQFLIIPAYATDRVKMDNYKSNYIQKIVNPDEALEKRISQGLSTDKDKSNYSIDVNDWGIIEGTYDEVYRGNIFIPITNNMNTAAMAYGDNHTQSQVLYNEQLYQDFNKYINMKPTNETK